MNLWRCAGCAAVYAFTTAEYDDDRCHCPQDCCNEELLQRLTLVDLGIPHRRTQKSLDTNPTTP